jgi:hypothetical protein
MEPFERYIPADFDQGRVHALEGRPIYLTDHLVSSLIRRDEEKWYGDIGLLGEQIAQMEVVLSISNAASIELPSSQSTSINSMVLLVTGSNCFGRIALRRGISPRR